MWDVSNRDLSLAQTLNRCESDKRRLTEEILHHLTHCAATHLAPMRKRPAHTSPLRPRDSMLEKDEVVQEVRTLDPVSKMAGYNESNANVGVREGRTLHMTCVDVHLKWCKISSVNRKSIGGT